MKDVIFYLGKFLISMKRYEIGKKWWTYQEYGYKVRGLVQKWI